MRRHAAQLTRKSRGSTHSKTGHPWSVPVAGRAASPPPHLALCAHTSRRRGERHSALRRYRAIRMPAHQAGFGFTCAQEEFRWSRCASACSTAAGSRAAYELCTPRSSRPWRSRRGTASFPSPTRCAARGSASRSELARLTDLGAFPVDHFYRPRG